MSLPLHDSSHFWRCSRHHLLSMAEAVSSSTQPKATRATVEGRMAGWAAESLGRDAGGRNVERG